MSENAMRDEPKTSASEAVTSLELEAATLRMSSWGSLWDHGQAAGIMYAVEKLEPILQQQDIEIERLRANEDAACRERDEYRSRAHAAEARLAGLPGEEEIARLVNPKGWATFDRQTASLKQMAASGERIRPSDYDGPKMYVAYSIKKARAILTLIQGARHDG